MCKLNGTRHQKKFVTVQNESEKKHEKITKEKVEDKKNEKNGEGDEVRVSNEAIGSFLRAG